MLNKCPFLIAPIYSAEGSRALVFVKAKTESLQTTPSLRKTAFGDYGLRLPIKVGQRSIGPDGGVTKEANSCDVRFMDELFGPDNVIGGVFSPVRLIGFSKEN